MNGAVVPEIDVFLCNFKTERALVNVSALYAGVKRHSVRIVGIDYDTPEETVIVFVECEGSGASAAQNKSCIMIDKRSNVRANNASESAFLYGFGRAGPKFIDRIEYRKITLDNEIAPIVSGFFSRGEVRRSRHNDAALIPPLVENRHCLRFLLSAFFENRLPREE